MRRRLASGSFWSIVGVMSNRVLVLVLAFAVARCLGAQGFGQFSIIQATVLVLCLFALSGIGASATKYVAEFRTSDPSRASRVIGITGMGAVAAAAVMAGLLVLGARWLSSSVLASEDLATPLRAGALWLFFTGLSRQKRGALAGLEAFRTIAVSLFLEGLAKLVLVAVGAHLWQLEGAVLGLSLASFLVWIFDLIALRIEARRAGVPAVFSGCLREWRTLTGFAFPVAVGNSLEAPIKWIGAAMLVNQPHGYAAMGVFGVALQWANALRLVPFAVSRAIFPALSGLHGMGDGKRHRRVLLFGALLTGLLAAGAALLVGLLSPLILRGYGPGFAGGTVTLVVMAASSVFAAIAMMLSQGMLSGGRVLLALFFRIVWAVIALISTLILVGRFLALGLAVSLLLAFVAYAVLLSVYVLAVKPRRRNSGNGCHLAQGGEDGP